MPSIRALTATAIGVAVLAHTVATAQAQSEGVEKGPLGLGIIVGEPTGVSAKLYLDDDTAVDAALGSAVVSGGLQAHADYLLHPWILTDESSFVLPAYVGGGIRILDGGGGRSESEFHLGIRAVVGMLFDFKSIPLDVFVEVAGVVDYVFSDVADDEGIGFGLNGGAGVRYYF
jgi:hypothetical protein